MKKPLLDILKERILVGDGAMGTQLQFAGLESGHCGELWNVDHPEKVVEIQRRYVDAGSDVLLTNTFGGSRIMLERHGAADRTAEINKAGVAVAREAFGDKEGYVIGDIGPFGGLMEPLGDIPESDVRAAFEEQAQAFVEAGVDAIIVETQTSYEEMAVGIEMAKKVGAPCIIASWAYDVTHDLTECRTMMGIDPDQAGEFIDASDADIVAMNCGTGIDMDWAAKTTARYRKVTSKPIMVQPNAGLPVLENLVVKYKQTPEEMVAALPALVAAGPNIIGACCGSTPEHIAMVRRSLDALMG